MTQKVGVKLSPRTGRPKIDNPKLIEIKARIDKETNKRLLDYCKKNNTTRTKVIRQGIEMIMKNKEE